jgi:predicted naringenin-chalcone synthase
LRVAQADAGRRLARLWGLEGEALARWERIVAASAVETRHGVVPIEEVVALSTGERMRLYEREAPPLAGAAARSALRSAAVAPARVTDLIVVSCTGFSAPGLDVDLVERLGLRPTVRRSVIGFMGCFGAVIGLRAAVASCAADPRGVALVVCLELCSLHLRAERESGGQVASALFADGAAAAVVAGRSALAAPGAALPAPIGALGMGASRLISRGRDWMTWRITDSGFAMTLAREVPATLRAEIASAVREASPVAPRSYIVHPGGPAIIDAVDAGLDLGGGSGLDAARDVLRRCGNMSSATILFVLDEALRRGCPRPAILLAFGPGLAIESLTLR